MKKLNLPGWLEEILPEPREPNVIYFEGDVYLICSPNGSISEPFESLEEAYDYIGNSTLTYFDRSVPDENIDGMMYTVPHKNSGHLRGLFSNTESEKIRTLEETFDSWILGDFNKYLKQSKDFMNSYQFLNNHPALWSNPKLGGIVDPFYWFTDQGVKSLRIDPYLDEKDGLRFCGEMGARVLPEADHHYHDPRLDTIAHSYEELIIKMAAALHKTYLPNGVERVKSS